MSIRWGRTVAEWPKADGAAAEGFDFVQPVGSLAADLGDGWFRSQESRVAGGGIPCAACAVPLPADARVTERGFNLYTWMEHLKKATRRMATLGCRKLLWSDGRARVLPVEGETAELKEQALQFLFLLCEVAANHGIDVLIEPLGPRRTNFLNSMKEVGEIIDRVGKENLSSMISLRELESIDLPLDRIGDLRHMIRHVHLENPGVQEGARVCPRPSDGYDYRPFLRALKDIGYDGGIGLPGDADADGLAYCRLQWELA